MQRNSSFVKVIGVLGVLYASTALGSERSDPGASLVAFEDQNSTTAPVIENLRTNASPNFDATFYHLNLDLQFSPSFYLRGQTRVQGRVTDEPMTTLVLDFLEGQDTTSGLRIDSVVSQDGMQLSFQHAGEELRIELARQYATGEYIDVDVFYQGIPTGSGYDDDDAFAFGKLSNGNPFAWTLSEPYGARAWWPCKDHPADKADSVRVTVTVPREMRVGSQGLLINEMSNDNDTKTYDWFSRYPISTYLVSIAAGVYDVYEQTYTRPDSLAAVYGPREFPVLHYKYDDPPMAERLPDGWAAVTDMLGVFEYWFGPYPFEEEKYGHAQFTWGGGMEHQTMSSMGGFNVGLVAHELAHMWFGDLITLERWPHLWLNEGFASYAELLYWQARSDLYPGFFDNALTTDLSQAKWAEGTLVVHDTLDVGNLFSGARVYAKGSAVMHMLRGITGDEIFRDILHAYTSSETVRYGTALTEDFQRIAEQASGMDLDFFFRQWITQGTGYPVYDVRWKTAETDTGYTVIVDIAQQQELPLSNIEVFEMPITLAVVTEEGEKRFTVKNDKRIQQFTLPTTSRPTDLVFDPDRYVLGGISIKAVDTDSTPDVPNRTSITKVYPNPASTTANIVFETATTGTVKVEIFDVLGRRVRTINDGVIPEGSHDYEVDLAGLRAGMYFIRLLTPSASATQTLVVSGAE